jgi:hypothetical protein
VHQDPAWLDQIGGFPDSGDQDWLSSHPAALLVSMALTTHGFVGSKSTNQSKLINRGNVCNICLMCLRLLGNLSGVRRL